MKKFGLVLLLCLLPMVSAPAQTPAPVLTHQAFWEKFREAVIKGNKPVVANMSQFPISMPYGMGTIRNRAQLLRRYRDVFNHEGSAAKCFVDAQPKTEPERPKEFTVGCKNQAGDEVVIYSFTKTRKGWKFTGLDNINE